VTGDPTPGEPQQPPGRHVCQKGFPTVLADKLDKDCVYSIVGATNWEQGEAMGGGVPNGVESAHC
jgi:hypothetical protein